MHKGSARGTEPMRNTGVCVVNTVAGLVDGAAAERAEDKAGGGEKMATDGRGGVASEPEL